MKIVFENQNFLVIDKPAGLVVHSDHRTQEESLSGWVESFWRAKFMANFLVKKIWGINFARPALKLFLNFYIKQKKNIGGVHTLDSGRYEPRWGMVNRLDRETVGLIIIAKNNKTFNELQKLFLYHKISKKYQALLWGEVEIERLLNQEKIFVLSEDEKLKNNFSSERRIFKITEQITRHKKDPRIWTCGFTSIEGARSTGRSATTFFEVVEVKNAGELWGQKFSNQKVSRINFWPQTGRTHQLRLHSRFLGHPIIGDEKYGLNGIINEHSTRQIENLLNNFTPDTLLAENEILLKLLAQNLKFKLDNVNYNIDSLENL